MIDNEEVGRRIRRARQALGLSQAALGEQLSRSRSHAAISEIERGRTKLGIEEIGDFAAVLMRPVEYFVGKYPPEHETPAPRREFVEAARREMLGQHERVREVCQAVVDRLNHDATPLTPHEWEAIGSLLHSGFDGFAQAANAYGLLRFGEQQASAPDPAPEPQP